MLLVHALWIIAIACYLLGVLSCLLGVVWSYKEIAKMRYEEGRRHGLMEAVRRWGGPGCGRGSGSVEEGSKNDSCVVE